MQSICDRVDFFATSQPSLANKYDFNHFFWLEKYNGSNTVKVLWNLAIGDTMLEDLISTCCLTDHLEMLLKLTINQFDLNGSLFVRLCGAAGVENF